MKLTPIGEKDRPYLRHQNQNLMALQGATGHVIVAVDSTASSPFPLWALPICVKPSKCSLSGSVLSCRGGKTYNLASGTPVIQKTGSAGSSAAPDTTQPNMEVEAIPEPMSSDDSENMAMSENASAGEEFSDRPPAFLLTTATNEDIPYRLIDGKLLGSDDTTISAELGAAPFWGVEAAKNHWINSDGETVLAVSRDEVLWDLSLPDGSAGLNEFTGQQPPSWRLAGHVLLLGTPDGVVALNTETGEEAWKVEAPVTSWAADGENLLITTEEGLAVLPFPTGEEPAGESAGSAQSGDQSGTDAGIVWLGEADAVPVPTFTDFQNADLPVPGTCAAADGFGGAPVPFEGGVAVNPLDPSQAVAMTAFTQIIIGGNLFNVLALDCDAYGDQGTPILAVYDGEKQLVGLVDYLQQVDVPDPQVQELFGVGTAVNVVLAPSEVPACGECTAGQPTLVTLLWDGEGFATVRVADAEDVTAPSGNVQVMERPVRPALTAAEIANATLFFPAGLLEEQTRYNPPNPDETIVFSDYKSVNIVTNYGMPRANIDPENIREITVGGQSYTLISIQYWQPSGSGERGRTLCALNPDGVAVACTSGPNPSKWRTHVIREVAVDGNEVTYFTGVGSALHAQGWVTESFDGNQFIPVTWEIRDVLGNAGALYDAG